MVFVYFIFFYSRLLYKLFQSCQQHKYSVKKTDFVGNKPKGRISKQVLEGNKARQVFRKTKISYPLIRTRTCASSGGKKCLIFGKFGVLVFLKHPLWDSPFCLITDDFRAFGGKGLSPNLIWNLSEFKWINSLLFSLNLCENQRINVL